MLQCNRVKMMACLLVVGALVAVSYGGARKIKALQTFSPEPVNADGMAFINYVAGQDKVIAQVILSDFTPDTQYVVVIGSVGQMIVVSNGCPPGMAQCLLNSSPDNTITRGTDGSLKTNAQGHLTVHLSNNPGDGNQFLDGVAVCTLADWNNTVQGTSGVAAFGF